MIHTFDTEQYGEVSIERTGDRITVHHRIDNIYREDVTRPLYSDGDGHYWIIMDGLFREVMQCRNGWYLPRIGADSRLCCTTFSY